MKTSSRPREIGGSFASRRGHGPQISISDTNHHVTEAIGDMYGSDDEYSKRDSRPLSFVTSPTQDAQDSRESYFDANRGARPRASPHTNGVVPRKSNTSPAMMQSPKSKTFETAGQLSPSLSLREHAVDANSQFPLSDIDYESDPAAVAQELSNLQALRRMSMDVGSTSDPDLPSFQGVSLMPSVAPTGDDDEADPSRLFWVPARVHPELAPMEFKTFLENRVQSIKRRSGEMAGLSPEAAAPISGGSLRRKKSMLSRQIDNEGGRGALGYKDGAEQLGRNMSLGGTGPELRIADLKELDALVRDPSKAMQTLTLDTNNRQGGSREVSEDEDMPILPQAPGVGLRRSTRTTYRRGSLRKGERVPFSKRAGSLRGQTQTEGEESPLSSPIDGRQASSATEFPLMRVQTEPISAENFSRPNRGARRMQNLTQTTSLPPKADTKEANTGRQDSQSSTRDIASSPQPGSLPRSTTFPRQAAAVPKIIETPPPPEDYTEPPPPKHEHQFPERSSSQQSAPPAPQQQQRIPEPPARSNRRPVVERQNSGAESSSKSYKPHPSQSLNEMAQHPSPLPGSNASTDTLTFIPTLDEKKSEKKLKKEKDESDNSSSRKPGWGWFKGSDEKEKKEKKKEEELKRNKAKTSMEKTHDSARLDVLQSTMDSSTPRGRESLLLDREVPENRLQEERKKESSRKSGSEKKEKDGLFAFFTSSKKKGDRDSGGKKGSSLRTLSPDPPHREMKPDIDYNWTRFSILEERAIYRMAHIKLANPRRALHSQVLLSNFMYSYLAKVQQMHPQMQVPQSALQKKQEAERRQKEQEQQALQQLEQDDQHRYDYHQGITQYAEHQQQQPPQPEGVTYVDDSQIYDFDHQDDDAQGQSSHRPPSRASQHNHDNAYSDHGQYQRRGGNEYNSYGQSDQQDHGARDDEMW